MNQEKVILIVIDGLANSVATRALGCVHSWIEAGIAKHQHIRCELPSMSRPLYETILTGKTPYESGIYVNEIQRLSAQQSLFHQVSAAGLTTAAAAYHWISELYNQSPYDRWLHRIQSNPSQPIQHGIFYHQDFYPDMAVFQDADYLRRTYSPDFMLVHPMNVDDIGHHHGVHSDMYIKRARQVDAIMGDIVPQWLAAGYQLIITSDHGMNTDIGVTHGGTDDIERCVPLYAVGHAAMQAVPDSGAEQTQIITYIKTLLALE